MGVQFFFALSGFLITSILLRCRERIDRNQQTRSFVLRQFHVRRALRIVPLYYVVLFSLYVAGYGILRESIVWHGLFVMNFWRSLTGIQFLNHLWAVAVEQQFCLVWPFFVLFSPRRMFIPTILFLMALAPVYRAFAWYSGASFITLNTIPLASLDTFGMGALLAILGSTDRVLHPIVNMVLFRIGPWIGAGSLLLLSLGRVSGGLDGLTQAVFLGSLLTPLYARLLLAGARGLSGPAGRLLESRPLRHIGMISYGIYVLHPLVRDLVLYGRRNWALPCPENVVLRFVVFAALSLLAAETTWYTFEKPLNGLKRYFPYSTVHGPGQ